MSTDREKLKLHEAAEFASDGSDPAGTVGEAHQETFKFDIDADASLAERGVRMSKKCIIKSAHFTPSSALAAHAAAYVTYTVATRDGAGGAASTISSFDTATGGDNVSLSAFVPQAFTLDATYVELAAGSVLTFKAVESSTPVSPLGCCDVTVEYI